MKYRKAFLPNPNRRFSAEPVNRIADEIIYICLSPMFDDMCTIEHAHHYEGAIVRALENFDPEQDIMVFFGDAVIFGMMTFYAAQHYDEIKIARYSAKRDEYIVRVISFDIFEKYEEMENGT